jgi:SET domain-containing protein
MTNSTVLTTTGKGRLLALSLDLLTSLLNHDCQPNFFVFLEDGTLRARSLRPIRAGEELTRCYVEPDMSALERQDRLTEKQFFECTCQSSPAQRTMRK